MTNFRCSSSFFLRSAASSSFSSSSARLELRAYRSVREDESFREATASSVSFVADDGGPLDLRRLASLGGASSSLSFSSTGSGRFLEDVFAGGGGGGAFLVAFWLRLTRGLVFRGVKKLEIEACFFSAGGRDGPAISFFFFGECHPKSMSLSWWCWLVVVAVNQYRTRSSGNERRAVVAVDAAESGAPLQWLQRLHMIWAVD